MQELWATQWGDSPSVLVGGSGPPPRPPPCHGGCSTTGLSHRPRSRPRYQVAFGRYARPVRRRTDAPARRPRSATPPRARQRDRAQVAGPLGGGRAPSGRPTRLRRALSDGFGRRPRTRPPSSSCSTCSRTRAAPACTSATRSATSAPTSSPVPAHERAQRAARHGVRRVRAAGRAVRGPDRPAPARHHRGQHRQHAPPAAGAGARPRLRAAASPPPTSPTTGGRSGSSCRSSTPGTTPRPTGPGRSTSSAASSTGRRTDPTTGRAVRELDGRTPP